MHRNLSIYRDAYFRNKEIELNLVRLEADIRDSALFKDLPEHYLKMTSYTILGAGFEILIQSYLGNDNFSNEEITDYISIVLENRLKRSEK